MKIFEEKVGGNMRQNINIQFSGIFTVYYGI